MTSSRQVVTFARYTRPSRPLRPVSRVLLEKAGRAENLGGKPLANFVGEKWRTDTREGKGVIFERRVYRRISTFPLPGGGWEEICCECNLKNYDFIHEPYSERRKEARDDSIARIFLSSEEFHGDESRHPFPTIYLAPEPMISARPPTFTRRLVIYFSRTYIPTKGERSL